MKIALIGNQNSGKTTLFNLLTGMNAKIGNWPGVTIEKKTGVIKWTNYELVDLPGIYSLSPYSSEEKISANFIFEENPDVTDVVVDGGNADRLPVISSAVGVILFLGEVIDIEGVLAPNHQIVNVLADYVL